MTARNILPVLLLILVITIPSVSGCTTFVVTKEASEDGSVFVGHYPSSGITTRERSLT